MKTRNLLEIENTLVEKEVLYSTFNYKTLLSFHLKVKHFVLYNLLIYFSILRAYQNTCQAYDKTNNT